MIFIFTNKEDTHPTNVIKHLVGGGFPVFRLNTECLLVDYEFRWWCNGDGADFYIKNIKNGLEVYGHEITAVWDRRPQVPKQLPVIHKNRAINKYNREEAHEFLSFLRYYMKDIYSIGNIVADRYASSKMLQLSIASQLGMKIPDTCFANNKESFKKILDCYKYVSLKTLTSSSLFVDGEQEYVFFSQKADSASVGSQPEAAFKQTVSFLQNYIEKQYELRITVCCDDVIACKIDSQRQTEETGKVDWRQGYEHDLKHEIVDIPEEIKRFCLAFLEKMGLNFGCFDFIVTPTGEYVFLECNPNGQWLWIELLTGFDISKIIAKNLAKNEIIKNNGL